MTTISLSYDTQGLGDIRYKALVARGPEIYLSGSMVGHSVRPIIGNVNIETHAVGVPQCPMIPDMGTAYLIHPLDDPHHFPINMVVAGGRGRGLGAKHPTAEGVHPVVYFYTDNRITKVLHANNVLNYEVTAITDYDGYIYTIANPITPYSGDSQFVIFDPKTNTITPRYPCKKDSFLRFIKPQPKIQVTLTDITHLPRHTPFPKLMSSPIITTGFMRTSSLQMAGLLSAWTTDCKEALSYFHTHPEAYIETRYTTVCVSGPYLMVLGHYVDTRPVVRGRVQQRKTHFLHFFDYTEGKLRLIQEHRLDHEDGYNRYLDKFIVHENIVYIPCHYNVYRDTRTPSITIKERYGIQKWDEGCLTRHFLLDPDVNKGVIIEDFAIVDGQICYLTHFNNDPIIMPTGICVG